MSDALKDARIIGMMRRTDAFQQGGFGSGRFVEFLMLKDPQGFPHDIAFIGLAAGIDQAVNKLAEGGWKIDGHARSLRGEGFFSSAETEENIACGYSVQSPGDGGCS